MSQTRHKVMDHRMDREIYFDHEDDAEALAEKRRGEHHERDCGSDHELGDCPKAAEVWVERIYIYKRGQELHPFDDFPRLK